MRETARKLLTSRQEIMDYLGLSEYMYLKFVRLGLPVRYIDGRCYAHPDNVDEFLRILTRISSKNLSDEVIEGG